MDEKPYRMPKQEPDWMDEKPDLKRGLQREPGSVPVWVERLALIVFGVISFAVGWWLAGV